MKIIKITTANEISVIELSGNSSEDFKLMQDSVAGSVEHVMPRRLYSFLGGSNTITGEDGSCVSMLVNEEGAINNLPVNMIGSFLYKSDEHGNPIFGDVVIIGERWSTDGIDFCGICDRQFDIIYPALESLAILAKTIKRGNENNE